MGRIFTGCLAVIGAVVVGVFLLFLIFWTPSAKHETPASSSSVTQSQALARETAPTMTLSIAEIDADYAANEVAADRKYSGQIVRVFGNIDSIDKGPLGAVHIVLVSNPEMFGGGSPFGVDATMNPGSDDIAARLVRWQKVVLICKSVSRVIGSVMLSDCEFDLSTAHQRQDGDEPPLQPSY